MKALNHILGASARFDLLRALYYQHREVGLRQLARLAGVHPHSAERMLQELVDEAVIDRRKTNARTMFWKNKRHSDWHTLQAVFEAADRATSELQRATLNKRAQSILPFINEAANMLKRARKRTRVA